MRPDKNEKTPKIAAIALAAPEFRIGQKEAANYLLARFGEELGRKGRLVLKRIFGHPSVRSRHFAIEGPGTFFDEGPDARISRFTEKALELSCRALNDALGKSGVDVRQLKGLVVNTCTGYICPGLSTYMIERLGLPRDIKAFDLVGAGCSGALPNLELAGMILKDNPGGVAACISVEICSATFEVGDDLGLILSNALFSDGAAAALIWDRPGGLEIVSNSMGFAPEHRESIRFIHKNGRLRNQLSMELPNLVGEPVKKTVLDAISKASLRMEDIRHWAIHAGGEKIIDAIRDALGIAEEKTAPARKVLREHGNMSSPTVWFVLDEIVNNVIEPGDYCVMTSFGAGLSAHCAVLLNK